MRKRSEILVVAGQQLIRINVVAPFLPLLMAIRMKYPDDGELYIGSVKACERYAFRIFRLLRRRSNTGRSSFRRLAYRFYQEEVGRDELIAEIDERTRWYSPEQSIEEFYADKDENDYYHWSGIRYFLQEYEAHLARKQNKNVPDWSQLNTPHTIEHILPVTPSPEWIKCWPDEKERERYTHDLGNLCLTTDNSSYYNKPFDQKRGKAGEAKCYAGGDLTMERVLAKFDVWNKDYLLERRERMIMWAKGRWSLTVSEGQ